MKKQWIAIIVSSCLAALVVLGLLRLLAPQLLGVPLDLEIVQTGDKVAPFFDVVLNKKEITGKETYIKDPYLKHRVRPLDKKASTDLLGFRNLSVPSRIDVLAIGDSQTWGNNADVKSTWPAHLQGLLRKNKASVYNAAVGGWGAIEYMEMADRLLVFRPKVVVVAFYSGNDPLDSFMMGYAKERWASLRPPNIPEGVKKPRINYPPPDNEKWSVGFSDGVETVFTPHGRYACNMDHPAVEAGYAIMESAARRIAEMAHKTRTRAVFTIIPTKELAFYPRIIRENIEQYQKYKELIAAETGRIESLSKKLSKIPHAVYVDLVRPLQQTVLNTQHQIYSRSSDGHPTGSGYQVIAKALAPQIEKYL